MPRLNVEGDRLYFDNVLVGRISSNISLAVLRNMEDQISQFYYYAPEKIAAKEAAKDRNEFAESILIKIRAFAKRSGGLLTVEEIEDIISEDL